MMSSYMTGRREPQLVFQSPAMGAKGITALGQPPSLETGSLWRLFQMPPTWLTVTQTVNQTYSCMIGRLARQPWFRLPAMVSREIVALVIHRSPPTGALWRLNRGLITW